MPSRRAVLGAVSTVVASNVAGCVDDAGVPAGTEELTETYTPSERSDSPATRTFDGTETPYYSGDCVTTEKLWVDPDRESVAPKSLPEGPPEFEAGPVASFVGEYERAYLHNSVLQEDTESVGISVSIHSTEEVSGGFVVAVDSIYYYNLQAVTTDGGTATVVHADGPEIRKAYLVTRERLVRAEGEYEQAPDPREEGETVECWDAD